MDTVDYLMKIRKLEKQLETKDLEIKQLKKQVKVLQLMENKLLKEFDIMSNRLAHYMPFDGTEETIVYKKHYI